MKYNHMIKIDGISFYYRDDKIMSVAMFESTYKNIINKTKLMLFADLVKIGNKVVKNRYPKIKAK